VAMLPTGTATEVSRAEAGPEAAAREVEAGPEAAVPEAAGAVDSRGLNVLHQRHCVNHSKQIVIGNSGGSRNSGRPWLPIAGRHGEGSRQRSEER
jgi:hypothetical protein